MSSSSRRAISCWVTAPRSGFSISTVMLLLTVMTVEPTTCRRPSASITQSHRRESSS